MMKELLKSLSIPFRSVALLYFLLICISSSFGQKKDGKLILGLQMQISTPHYTTDFLQNRSVTDEATYLNDKQSPSYLLHIRVKNKKGWYVAGGAYHSKQTFKLDEMTVEETWFIFTPLIPEKSFTYLDISCLSGKEFKLSRRFTTELAAGISYGRLVNSKNNYFEYYMPYTGTTFPSGSEQFRGETVALLFNSGIGFKLSNRLAVKINYMLRFHEHPDVNFNDYIYDNIYGTGETPKAILGKFNVVNMSCGMGFEYSIQKRNK